MSPRLKLRAATPLVLAGALWGGTALAPVTHARAPYQAPCQTPPPCGPDGVCLPKYETYGWYQTRWRAFPGDVISKAPTKAEPTPAPGEDNLSGPQPPPPSQEGELGKPKPTRTSGGEPGVEEPPTGPEAGLTPGPATAPAPTTPAPEGLPTIPGGPTLPGGAMPEGGPAPGPGAGAAPAGPGTLGPDFGLPSTTAPAPGAGAPAPQNPAPQEKAPAPETPEQKLIDPFGAAPPTPPSWLRSAADERLRAGIQLQPLPTVRTAGIMQPAGVMPVVTPAVGFAVPVSEAKPAVFETPNIHSDDAPPALPPGLQDLTSAPIVRPQAAAPQPAPAQASRVVTASAEQPMSESLVQQADAIATDPAGGSLQQAIYFEASDQ